MELLNYLHGECLNLELHRVLVIEILLVDGLTPVLPQHHVVVVIGDPHAPIQGSPHECTSLLPHTTRGLDHKCGCFTAADVSVVVERPLEHTGEDDLSVFA
jgi:hypothetical protein